MKFGNRHIFRLAWSLARQGARRYGGRPSEFIRCAVALVYADMLKPITARPSAIKPLSGKSNSMRFAISVALASFVLAIAPVTHESVAFILFISIPSFVTLQIARMAWQWESPYDRLE
jgi:hypothetical protein